MEPVVASRLRSVDAHRGYRDVRKIMGGDKLIDSFARMRRLDEREVADSYSETANKRVCNEVGDGQIRLELSPSQNQ